METRSQDLGSGPNPDPVRVEGDTRHAGVAAEPAGLPAMAAPARLTYIWSWTIRHSDWRTRGYIFLGALCAMMFAGGTASLSLLVRVGGKHAGLIPQSGPSHMVLVVLLTGLFALRPLNLMGHIRMISAALVRLPSAGRPVPPSLLHRTLVVTTRDIPLLAMLAGSLLFQNGVVGLLALMIAPLGPISATFLIRRHVRKKFETPDADARFVHNRNALSLTEATSDFPQTLIMTAVILWFALHAEPLSHGALASVVISVMLASPPLRRLTKLSADIATKQGKDEED